MFLSSTLNFEQTDNAEYEQYLSEKERNYATYGRDSVDEEKGSNFVHTNVTYGQNEVQERS